MYFRDFRFQGDYGGSAARRHKRSESSRCYMRELPKFIALHRMFRDWRSLMEVISLYEEQYPKLYFRLGGDVVFALDKLHPEEVKTCEEDHTWCSVKSWGVCYFNRDSFILLKKSVSMIFFRPKDGTDQLYRFTVGKTCLDYGNKWNRIRRSVYKNAGFNVRGVISSFLKLLLKSKDDFATLVFVEQTGCTDLGDVPSRSTPGFSRAMEFGRRRFQFPNLPIKDILRRTDTVEFIGLDFDERSCRSFKELPTNIRELKFHSCIFEDGGRTLLDALQSPNHVQNFEIDQCPICPKVVCSLNSHRLDIQSLALGIHYQLNENGSILLKKLCQGKQLRNVTIICREKDLRTISKSQSDSLKEIFRHQQTLRKLSFVNIEHYEDDVWHSEQFSPKSFLDGSSMEVLFKIKSGFYGVDRSQYFNNEELQRMRLEALNKSCLRHALLCKAIDADATIAGNYKKTFSILQDNADVLCQS
ncbi:hypothetical protein IV203_014824 [Nitzschia inconspicua]|uniref:Uncharacterized protein n=1 Tax=Nitzschia inconspicua TaxID=303405 RepID=A0A9K3L9Q7_9STRA|nr:hypothetical protein IV203_014824 [Nitzschia inconspicua]